MAIFNVPVTRLSRVIPAVCLVLAFLFPIAHLQSASAQVSDEGFTGNNTYESLFGYEMTWDDPWEVDDQESGYTAANLQDVIHFSIPDSDTLLTVFASPLIGSLTGTIDFIVDQLGLILPDPELLDVASDKVSGHILVRVDPDGENLGLYVQSMASADKSTEIRVLVSGDLGSFDEIIEAAQESLTVDGNPMFDGVDAAELLDLLENGEAIPFPAVENAGLEDDDDDTSSENDDDDNSSENEDKKLPDEEDYADPAPTEEDEDAADSDPSDLGLIDEGEYESPQLGVGLEWNADWELSPDSLLSDSENGLDQVTLASADFDAAFYLTIFSADDLSIDDWVESFKSIADDESFGIEILDQKTRRGVEIILYSYNFDGEVTYGLIEVYEDEENNAIVAAEVSGSPTEVADAFDSAQDSIQLNGEAPFRASEEFPALPEEE